MLVVLATSLAVPRSDKVKGPGGACIESPSKISQGGGIHIVRKVSLGASHVSVPPISSDAQTPHVSSPTNVVIAVVSGLDRPINKDDAQDSRGAIFLSAFLAIVGCDIAHAASATTSSAICSPSTERNTATKDFTSCLFTGEHMGVSIN